MGRKALALVTPAVGAVVLIIAVALGAPAEPHFAVPVLPAFALLLAGGLLGPRRSAAHAE